MASDGTRTLRVGILCDSLSFHRWQAEAIRHVLQVPGVQLVVLVRDSSGTNTAAKPLLKRNWSTALYRLYRRKYFDPPAMEVEDLSELLARVTVVDVQPEVDGVGQRFQQKDLDAIDAERPDVLLRFGFNILKGDILTLPEFGVWSFHHGDPAAFRGGPPGLWEILKGSPVTGAILQRLTERLDGGRILRQGWFKTIDHSLQETVDTVLMHSAVWPAQVLRELLSGNAEAASGKTPEKLGTLYRYPGNLRFLQFLWTRFNNKLRFHREDLNMHEEWNIGVLYQPIAALLDDKHSLNVRWLPSPGAGSFRADPFGYTGDDGQVNLLYEKFEYGTGLGEIARVRPKKDNVLKRSRTMLKSEGHLSYPYVVQRDGSVYVVPEQAATGRVDLYRVNAANDALEPVGTLLEEALLDPTLFQHEGRWWLFGTKAPLTNVALYAYHAERLEGPYLPHLLNPIKLDIASARPGGTPFHHEGVLWRPAQDSSITYGGRIALNRVLELSPDRFREETVKHIGPLGGSIWNKGLHTLSSMGELTFIDGKRFVSVPERRREAKERKLRRLKRQREE
jgi:hypothetical protein